MITKMKCVSPEALSKLNESTKLYLDAEAYPHIVIDNFLTEDYLKSAVDYAESLMLKNADHKNLPPSKHAQYKYAYDKIGTFSSPVKEIFTELNSPEFVEMVSKLTGIQDLVKNNTQLKGAGIHKIAKDGYLRLHTDFNNYNDKKHGLLDRRINILIYLNPNWKEEYGGELWICDKKSKKCVDKILPILNRCVIFSTTNKSIHGHPLKLSVPDKNIHRNSLALYYYTKNKNGKTCFEGDKFHSTIYYNNHKEFTMK